VAVLPSLPSTPSNGQRGGVYRRQNAPSPTTPDFDLGPGPARARGQRGSLHCEGKDMKPALEWRAVSGEWGVGARLPSGRTSVGAEEHGAGSQSAITGLNVVRDVDNIRARRRPLVNRSC
jgi:hypothetical protein